MAPASFLGVRLATACATAFSVVTLLICFVSVPMIYSEVQSIWSELDLEMELFKVRPQQREPKVVRMQAIFRFRAAPMTYGQK